MAVSFSDSFDRGNNYDLGADWSQFDLGLDSIPIGDGIGTLILPTQTGSGAVAASRNLSASTSEDILGNDAGRAVFAAGGDLFSSVPLYRSDENPVKIACSPYIPLSDTDSTPTHLTYPVGTGGGIVGVGIFGYENPYGTNYLTLLCANRKSDGSLRFFVVSVSMAPSGPTFQEIAFNNTPVTYSPGQEMIVYMVGGIAQVIYGSDTILLPFMRELPNAGAGNYFGVLYMEESGEDAWCYADDFVLEESYSGGFQAVSAISDRIMPNTIAGSGATELKKVGWRATPGSDGDTLYVIYDDVSPSDPAGRTGISTQSINQRTTFFYLIPLSYKYRWTAKFDVTVNKDAPSGSYIGPILMGGPEDGADTGLEVRFMSGGVNSIKAEIHTTNPLYGGKLAERLYTNAQWSYLTAAMYRGEFEWTLEYTNNGIVSSLVLYEGTDTWTETFNIGESIVGDNFGVAAYSPTSSNDSHRLVFEADSGNIIETTNTRSPAQPSITTMSFHNINLSFGSSSFSDEDYDDSHTQTQWQIANDSDDEFDSPIYDSTSSTDLTSVYITDLLERRKAYRIRVRYKDRFGNWSEWSSSQRFITGDCDVYQDSQFLTWPSSDQLPPPSYLTKRTLQFRTKVTPMESGTETRQGVWSAPKVVWSLRWKVLTQEQMQVLEDFFRSCKGRLYSFTFSDPLEDGRTYIMRFASDQLTNQIFDADLHNVTIDLIQVSLTSAS